MESITGVLAEAYDRLDMEYELPSGLNSDKLLNLYIELDRIKDEATEKSKKAAALIEDIQEDVVKHFRDNEKQRDTRRGATIYISRELWPKILHKDLLPETRGKITKDQIKNAKEKARQKLIELLSSDASTEYLVKSAYNHNTLRSFILNDCEEDEETGEIIIPEHLEGRLGVSELFKAKVVKS